MTVLDQISTPDKLGRLLIAPTHRAGDFASHGADCPFVFTVDGRMGMTFVGWDGIGYQTALTWRGEGDDWSEPEIVFGRVPGSAHREFNSAMTGLLRDHSLEGAGELIVVDGWYYGSYHAYPAPGYEEGAAIIGIARSRDLVEWEEFGELFRPEDGAPWEQGGLYKSWLLRIDGRYWMFYNAKDQTDGDWVEQTGVAVSDDLRTWTRLHDTPVLRHGGTGAPDERFASDPCVLQAADGSWVMFYFGLSRDGHARELYATSEDLATWTKGGSVLIDIGPKGSVDDRHAHKPSVLAWNGRLEHYYCAVRRTEPFTIGDMVLDEVRGITVARSV